MTNYREILRLSSLGLNRTQIADSLGASRTTVIHALQRAVAQGLDWQTAEPLSDKELADRLFPQGAGSAGHKMPDYRACMALLKLSDQYTPERLETACAKALFYTPRPSYKAIQTILKSGQDKPSDEPETSSAPSEFGFTRGPGYYGRGQK